MPCAPFVGANHYGRRVLFGCGWSMIEMHVRSGRSPKATITGQCMAIQNAVAPPYPVPLCHLDLTIRKG
jgi:hypothetical protein